MEDTRPALANAMMDAIKNHKDVKDVFLRGSLSIGNMDEYSDIDIGVDVSGVDNGAFALDILPKIIESHFPVIFFDWAPSLFPKTYVQSYFISGNSPFWFIDIECIAKPHVSSVAFVKNDETGHLIKLWVQTAKCFLRKHPTSNNQVKALARRVRLTDT